MKMQQTINIANISKNNLGNFEISVVKNCNLSISSYINIKIYQNNLLLINIIKYGTR